MEEIQLDPREVLAHLKSLGYDNITKSQLKEFIKDLKRLIRYDLKKKNAYSESDYLTQHTAGKSSTETQTCTYPNKNETKNEFYDKAECEKWVDENEVHFEKPTKDSCSCALRPTKSVPDQGKMTKGKTPNCNCSEIHRRVMSVSQPTILPTQSVSSCPTGPPRPSSSCQSCGSKFRGTSKEKKENELRPTSSFIRPAKPSGKLKSDPVSLYHHYQKLWTRQQLPGENPRLNLRWQIRHKMMGPNMKKPSEERVNDEPRPEWVV